MNVSREILRVSRPLRYRWDAWTYRRTSCAIKLAELRGCLEGKPCLVIGSGPSLNETPLDDFFGTAAIGMNKIYLMFSRTKWRPSLIVCDNPLVAQQAHGDLAKIGVPTFFSWRARYMLPKSSWPSFGFYNTLLQEDFSTDLSVGVGHGPTVTYTALHYAYWMGADPVILFGVDHSFSTKGRALTYERREGADVNHFDPNYFQAGKMWGVPDLEGNERVYRHAKTAFERVGRKVFDATIGGKLKVFEKIDLATALTITGSARDAGATIASGNIR